MGTSSSYRSPGNPRWNVFNRALDRQLPLERLRVTLFLAGEAEWRDALRAPALASFAEVLVDAHSSLTDRLAESERPAAVVAAVVGEARTSLFEQEYSPALPVAERALRSVLIQTIQRPIPLADATGGQAAEAWKDNRGEPSELVRRFVGELFGQWSAHVMARDTGRLCGPGAEQSASDVRQLAQAMSRHVSELAESAPADVPIENISSHWQELVTTVFDRGRLLERAQ